MRSGDGGAGVCKYILNLDTDARRRRDLERNLDLCRVIYKDITSIVIQLHKIHPYIVGGVR